MSEKKKPKGSDSARKVLVHAHRGLELVAEFRPGAMGKINAFTVAAMKPQVLNKKEAELHALGMAFAVRCHYCIELHVRACKAAGVSIEEIMDVFMIAVMMGGGPVLTYAAELERALNEHYLDEEGEPVD